MPVEDFDVDGLESSLLFAEGLDAEVLGMELKLLLRKLNLGLLRVLYFGLFEFEVLWDLDLVVELEELIGFIVSEKKKYGKTQAARDQLSKNTLMIQI